VANIRIGRGAARQQVRVRARSRDGRVVRFGKLPAKRDARNLRFAAVLRAPLRLPDEYDFDVEHRGIPTPMFKNDDLGDCVIAGRAHQTLRFEDAEQGIVLDISDADVVREYFRETGGRDTGLAVLDSLNQWRRRGWRAAGGQFKIQAFAEIAPRNHREVKRAIFSDVGVGIGLNLPDRALTQFDAGQRWDVGTGRGSAANPDNGHYVHVPGYTRVGPVCVTWGRKQQMTWAFFDKYCDEAYAIIDAVNTRKKRQALDERKIRSFLDSL
jgi:hypothetical protein